MAEHVIIDGNNLLYAMHEHAPIPSVGRETMVKVIERWARRGNDEVTLVFDGSSPRGGMSKQMASSRIAVSFSAPQTADDVIIAMANRAKDPGRITVVSGDRAIQHAAKMRRCRVTESRAFVDVLFAAPDSGKGDQQAGSASSVKKRSEKPESVSADEASEWLQTFGLDEGDETLDDRNRQGG